LAVGSAPLHFDSGKFPEQGIDHAGRASTDEETAMPFDHERGKAPLDRGDSFSQVGQLVGSILAKGDAMFSDRAKRTLRPAWGANHRAQFHQGLIKVGTIRLSRPCVAP